ncbi:MAG: hypothetical protein ACKV0T_12740 [Planctomycetales bacterium]
MANSRGPTFCWWIALLIPCALQGVEIGRRGIDPDEFEHLHAAFMVWQGAVPYRDFFEHHGPLLYYALQPLFQLFGPELTVLWCARLAIWCCALGLLCATARLATRWSGGAAGLPAATLLAWTSVFHTKGIELRPDVPAALLVMGVALVAVGSWDRNSRIAGRFRWMQWLAAGVLAGLATLLTQKSIVPIAGVALAAALGELLGGHWRRAGGLLLMMLLGGGGAWGVATGLFAWNGSAADFWHGAVVQLLHWPVRSERWEHLRSTLAADFTVWIAAGLAVLEWLRCGLSRENWGLGRGLLPFAGLFCVGSLGWVQATYPQFYLLWMPLLVVLAVDSLSRLALRPVPRLVAGSLAIGLLAGQTLLVWRAARLGPAGALPHLFESTGSFAILWPCVLIPIGLASLWFLWRSSGELALWTPTGGLRLSRKHIGGSAGASPSRSEVPFHHASSAAPQIARRGGGAAAVWLCAALGMGYAAWRQMDAACWSNAPQVARVEELHLKVTLDQTVLDGFTGYGALRRHAYYYWWINEYSSALMSPEELGSGLLRQLRATPPAAVLFDDNLRRLPEEVTQWIGTHYQPGVLPPLHFRIDDGTL